MADDAVAFPTLTDADMAVMDKLGTRRPMAAGDYLYREGDPTYDFMVVVSGAVDMVVSGRGEEEVVAHHGAGRFLGELNMLTGMRVFVSARVAESGEVIVIPRERLRRLIATDPGLGDTILAAFIARRSVLMDGASSTTRLIGSRYCPLCLQVREFLSRSRIPYEWLDPDSDPEVEALLEQFGVDPDELPVVITSGTVLRRPSPGQLAEYLGLTLESLPGRCFDLVVVGGGPAGLAAAVYGATEGLNTLGVEKFGVGGQAGSSSRIENYLGFPMGISGGELTGRAVVQAEKFGAHLTAPCEAVSLREEAGHLIVRLSDGSDVGGARRHCGQRRAVPAPSRRPPRAIRGKRRLLRGNRNGAPPVRGISHGGRRWRELSGAGGHVPLRLRPGHRRHPRRRPRQEHVALPDRSH